MWKAQQSISVEAQLSGQLTFIRALEFLKNVEKKIKSEKLKHFVGAFLEHCDLFVFN